VPAVGRLQLDPSGKVSFPLGRSDNRFSGGPSPPGGSRRREDASSSFAHNWWAPWRPMDAVAPVPAWPPMAEQTVVVIEDDANIADLLDLYLREAGYRVLLAPTGERGLDLVRERRPVLTIIDIGLPGIDGFEVCRRIREDNQLPILFLTARDGEIDRVLGLELGADDYVTKPFSPREVVARVRAILRRGEAAMRSASAVIDIGEGIVINLARREVAANGAPVALANREFDLLAHFATNQGIALSRQQLLDAVWGPDWYGDERTVDVHVRQLRLKVGRELPLATVWGVGYRLG
jgi:DNA-binding response OmpR family regulator